MISTLRGTSHKGSTDACNRNTLQNRLKRLHYRIHVTEIVNVSIFNF